MDKKTTVFFVLAVMATIVSCVSAGTREGYSEIVVRRDESMILDVYKVRIYVDGKLKDRINAQKSRAYKVPNGNHEVYIESIYEAGLLLGHAWDFKETMRQNFTLNNERIILNASSALGRLEIVEKIALWRPEKSLNSVVLSQAAYKSFLKIAPMIPNGSKIAIVNIVSDNPVYSEIIIDELTMSFVNARQSTVVERETLEAIRREQNFQMSGDVDDDTIVGVGYFIGANIVITGRITPNNSHLQIKALNVRTSQVVAMSSEAL